TESAVRFETLPLNAIAAVIVDPSGMPFIHHAFRTEGNRLNLNNYEDNYYFTFEIGSTVRDDQSRFIHSREPRALQADIDAETARALRSGPVAYLERIPTISGNHTLGLMVENNLTGEFGRTEIRLASPGVGGEALDAGEPLLVREVTTAPQAYNAFGVHYAFQVGPQSMIPAIENDFPVDGTVTVFRQLFVPADRTEPVLTRTSVHDAGGQPIIEKADRVDPAGRDNNGVINYFAEISLQRLPPGAYSLVTEVEELDRRSRFELRIVAEESYTRPHVHSLPNPPAISARVRVARAEQLRTVGRTDEAVSELAHALRREPDLEPALKLQIELLQDAGRYSELDALLTPRTANDPNNSELLILVGEVKAQLAEHYDAIRFYERARIAGAEETPELLNALASEYYADGRLDRTRELLLQSLEIDPDQPQMQRLLEAVTSGEEP
ncbi:MAG TPA: tetratricopeptide repeat protein, partial [Acidobacteriota bacterium]|nr:tetratricopeptide repeat protein [Acidobacteriota bacterium]